MVTNVCRFFSATLGPPIGARFRLFESVSYPYWISSALKRVTLTIYYTPLY
jgi:hypothetical protein